ncbi:hypothetical protein DTO166G4_3230 [Paecilomyces variotii]|nr:hypothetical protein DTO166G4_3230 [Paecilomyces variotii]KAJ9237617.1 hypothetical protein DTO166G5_3381 [Paecilomyces variotii]KAJ9353452.1 hypothetical protein DTO280E4_7275 [Paecilomyces variotii]
MEAVQSIFMHFNTVRQARQDLVPHNRLQAGLRSRIVKDASRITAISVTSESSSANEREDKTVIGWSSSLARRNIEECYERPHYGKD